MSGITCGSNPDYQLKHWVSYFNFSSFNLHLRNRVSTDLPHGVGVAVINGDNVFKVLRTVAGMLCGVRKTNT